MNKNDRAYYLDWIKIVVILLLVPAHSAVTFISHGHGFIRYPQSVPLLDMEVLFLKTWLMPLLFVVSGVASHFSLQYRTPGQYARERHTKILIPLLTGLLLVCPPMAYLRVLFIGSFKGSLLQFYPGYFTGGVYPHGNLTWGHLWFLAYLYVFTLILLPLFMRIKRRTPAMVVAVSEIMEKGFWIYIATIPLMITEMVLRPSFPGFLNLVQDWANFTLYLALVLYGFLFISNDRILDNIQRNRVPSLVLASVLFLAAASLRKSVAGTVLSPLFPAYNVLIVFAWIFAALGYARQFLNRRFRFYNYLKNASYPFYILHYLPVTVASYFIARSDLNVWLKYLVIIVFSYLATFALYEIIRRIPVVRFLFGVRNSS